MQVQIADACVCLCVSVCARTVMGAVVGVGGRLVAQQERENGAHPPKKGTLRKQMT